MKSLVLLLLLPLVGLLCSCSGSKEPKQPLAAAFEYGDASFKSTQAPIFVLYDNGTLIFRKRNGARFDYLRLDLNENEQAELMAHVENVVKEPALKERYELSPELPSNYGTAFVFYSEKSSTVVSVDDLKAIEVSALRLSEGPDFSGDVSFPNSLIQFITTMGMLRVSAADEWRSASADRDHLFPSQERWNKLKFETALNAAGVPQALKAQGLDKESLKPQLKSDLKTPVKVTP